MLTTYFADLPGVAAWRQEGAREGFEVVRVDGVAAPHLDGCLDVDLESSALTNTLPVHRLAPAPGQLADAPAAYVAVGGLRVERLEQTYARVEEGATGPRFDCEAPAFDFAARLTYDRSGLASRVPVN